MSCAVSSAHERALRQWFNKSGYLPYPPPTAIADVLADLNTVVEETRTEENNQ